MAVDFRVGINHYIAYDSTYAIIELRLEKNGVSTGLSSETQLYFLPTPSARCKFLCQAIIHIPLTLYTRVVLTRHSGDKSYRILLCLYKEMFYLEI